MESSCWLCINAIMDKMLVESKNTDEWYQQMLVLKERTHMKGIVNCKFCHACEFDNKLKSSGSIIPKIIPSEHSLGRYSGALFFREFNLFILSTPPGIVDVMSMGEFTPTKKEKKEDDSLYHVDGASHCVISNRLANLIERKKSKLPMF